MRNLFRGVLVLCASVVVSSALVAQDAWSTDYVSYGIGGHLSYGEDEEGNVIPDFSHVGYRFGDEEIPSVGVSIELSPVDGDDGANIQAAIESLYSVTPDENGFRGAVLLKAGTYEIEDQLLINESGIVLRGEGEGDDGTILLATGTSKRVLVEFGTSGSLSKDSGSKVEVKENFVPLGRKYVIVDDASEYAAGEQIAIYRPGTAQWISDIKMDQISSDDDGTPSSQWTASSYSFYFEREVSRVNGDSIFFRNPIVMALDKNYGGGFVYKSSMNRIENVGIENICFKSEYASDTDESHSWSAVQFNNVEHGWAKNITAWYFAFASVAVEIDAKHISVIDCSCFEPKSIITGGRRYSFYCVGQLNLFQGCVTTEGRHDYVTSSRVCGPNVFTRCSATSTHADIGPHHRWAMGTLYDIIETDGEINVQDRDNMGSGHGWAGANQVFWNCIGESSVCQSPWASAKNYNFGFIGDKSVGARTGRPDGVWVGHNRRGLFPSSLYEAQLEDRIDGNLVFSVLYDLESISDSSFRMYFTLPIKTSTIIPENFVVGGTAGLEDSNFILAVHDAYSVDIIFSEIGLLPSFSTLTIEAENVLSEGDLGIAGLSTSVYLEPDQRPVVSGPLLEVTNEPGSFAVMQSTKLGYVYLIRMGEDNDSVEDFERALAGHNAVRAEVTKVNVSVPVYTQGIYGGIYLMYAIDEVGRISEAGDQIVIVEEVIGVDVEAEEALQKFSLQTGRSSVFIQPSNQHEAYKVSVYDVNGRLISDSDYMRGSRQVQLLTSQLMIVRITGPQVNEVHKLIVFGD